MHLHGELEQIVQTLTLGLCFDDVVPPDITADRLDKKSKKGEDIRGILTFHVVSPKPRTCQDIRP